MLEPEIQAVLDEISQAKERMRNIERRSAGSLGSSATKSRTDAERALANLREAEQLLEKILNGHGKK